MTAWEVGWLIWLAVVLVSFGIYEYIGIRREGTAGSLSWVIWNVLFRDADRLLKGDYPKRPRPVIFFVVGGALLWLFLHFVLGGRLG